MMTREEIIRLATGLRTDFKCESDTMVDFCNSIIRELEEKKLIVNQMLDKIKVDIENNSFRLMIDDDTRYIFVDWANEIIDKYKEIK